MNINKWLVVTSSDSGSVMDWVMLILETFC